MTFIAPSGATPPGNSPTTFTVALLTDGVAPLVLGGMQSYAHALAIHLARLQARVELFHTRGPRPSAATRDAALHFDAPIAKNICAHEIAWPTEARLQGRAPGHYVRESWHYSRALTNALRELTRTTRVDAVFAQGFCAWHLLQTRERDATLRTLPIAVHLHGFEMFQAPPNLRATLEAQILRRPARECAQKADLVVSFGGQISELIARLGVPSSRVVEISGAIGDAWLQQSPPALPQTAAPSDVATPRRFVFVGRYERRKGIEELSEVARERLTRQNENAELAPIEWHFVGPIPDALRLSHAGAVYHGAQSDAARLREILRECDVLLCPSHSEGMPIVIMEGMACGLAIIATDVGAVSRLVDESVGWLLQPRLKLRDELPSLLRAAVDEAASLAPQELLRKRVAAQEKVRRDFNWDNIAAQTLDALKNAKPRHR